MLVDVLKIDIATSMKTPERHIMIVFIRHQAASKYTYTKHTR